MQSLHEHVKRQLHVSSAKYKEYIDLKTREVQFEVGDLVLVLLSKEIFLRGEYNKLKMKNIRTCKVLRKFLANAYERESLEDIGISHIFNVANLYLYKGDVVESLEDLEE
jgi:hypothetical protein